MPRVPQISYDSASPEVREAHDDHIRRHARITNMKRTLLNSLPAFHALMEWYPLRDTVQPFLGPRLTVLFAHAISAETDCLICCTFFRRILIEEGEDPDRLDARRARARGGGLRSAARGVALHAFPTRCTPASRRTSTPPR